MAVITKQRAGHYTHDSILGTWEVRKEGKQGWIARPGRGLDDAGYREVRGRTMALVMDQLGEYVVVRHYGAAAAREGRSCHDTSYTDNNYLAYSAGWNAQLDTLQAAARSPSFQAPVDRLQFASAGARRVREAYAEGLERAIWGDQAPHGTVQNGVVIDPATSEAHAYVAAKLAEMHETQATTIVREVIQNMIENKSWGDLAKLMVEQLGDSDAKFSVKRYDSPEAA